MKKTAIILSVLIFGSFLVAGSAMATPFNLTRPDVVGPGNLQSIFDTKVPGLNAENDQVRNALWSHPDGDSNTYAVHLESDKNGDLYIYNPNNLSQIYLLFDDDYSDTVNRFTVQGGTIAITLNGNTSYNWFSSNNFGFAFKLDEDNAPFYYTEDDKNTGAGGTAGAYRAIVYNTLGLDVTTTDKNPLTDSFQTYGTDGDDYIIAFEGTTNSDYDEGVFFIEDLKAVPEPAIMLLLGTGLIGLAAFGRKNFVK